MITLGQFEKVEDRISEYQVAGLNLERTLREIGATDEAANVFEALKRTSDEMRTLRQALRPIV